MANKSEYVLVFILDEELLALGKLTSYGADTVRIVDGLVLFHSLESDEYDIWAEDIDLTPEAAKLFDL